MKKEKQLIQESMQRFHEEASVLHISSMQMGNVTSEGLVMVDAR